MANQILGGAQHGRVVKLTEREVGYLNSLVNSGDRGGYYMAYYNMTGSEQAIDQTKISTFSGVAGGAAYAANLYLQHKFVPLGKYAGIYNLSQRVALSANDAVNFGKNTAGWTGYIDSQTMFGSARQAWIEAGQGNQFPGNIFSWVDVARNAVASAGLEQNTALQSGQQLLQALDDLKAQNNLTFAAFNTLLSSGSLAALGGFIASLAWGKTLNDFKVDGVLMPGYRLVDTPDGKFQVLINAQTQKTEALFDSRLIQPITQTNIGELLGNVYRAFVTNNMFADLQKLTGYQSFLIDALTALRRNLTETAQPFNGDAQPNDLKSTYTPSGYSVNTVASANNDSLWGSVSFAGIGGNDNLNAGAGDDVVFGGTGDDTLAGSNGNDVIYGQKGNDILDGGNDSDVLRGGVGNDQIEGGEGDDILDGGDITLTSGTGNDVLRGGAGDDQLFGGDGEDTLEGGDGEDTYYFSTGSGKDTIKDIDGKGTLNIDGEDLTVEKAKRNLQHAGTWTHEGFTFTLKSGDIENGGDLLITGEKLTGGSLLVKGFKNKDLGITLDDQKKIALSGRLEKNIFETGAEQAADVTKRLAEGGGQTINVMTNFVAGLNQRIRIALVDGIESLFNKLKLITGAETLSFNSQGYVDIDVTEGKSQHLLALVSSSDADEDLTGKVKVTLLDANGQPVTNEDGSAVSGGMNINFDATDESTETTNTIIGDQQDDKNDVLDGTSGDDSIDGLTGANRLYGGGGKDQIQNVGTSTIDQAAIADGGTGDDTIFIETVVDDIDTLIDDGAQVAGTDDTGAMLGGGEGDDRLIGGDQRDLLLGGTGDDLIVAGGGDDIIIGDQLDVDPNADGFSYQPEIRTNSDGSNWLHFDIGGTVVEFERTFTGGGDDTVHAGGGNDVVYGDSGNDTLFGEDGNDNLRGGQGDDIILGGVGNDVLWGERERIDGFGSDGYGERTGSDFIDGGDGADWIYGNNGDDILFGGKGMDRIWGGAGNDTLDGESGASNRLSGGEGDDTLFGGDEGNTLIGDGSDSGGAEIEGSKQGNDTIYGGEGVDLIVGGGGKDILDGGDGDDQIEGDSATVAAAFQGNDEIDGGDGKDTIVGGGKNDTIFGGKGDDIILGDTNLDGSTNASDGDDTIDGEEGNDTINGQGGKDIIAGGTGNDLLSGGSEADILNGDEGNDELQGGTGEDRLVGGDGADKLFGDADNDTLLGGAGNDVIAGGDGVDTIDGGDGNDLLATDGTAAGLNGGAGDDTIYGGSGNDLLLGGDDNDHLFGEDGDDELQGGEGNDTLDGGEGIDVLFGGDGDDILISSTGQDYLAGEAGTNTYRVGEGHLAVIRDTNANTVIEIGRTDELMVVQQKGTANLVLVHKSSFNRDDLTTLAGVVLFDGMGRANMPTFKRSNGSTVDIAALLGRLGPMDVVLPNIANKLLMSQSGGKAVGGNGDDELIGARGNDELIGGAGNDVLSGAGGVNMLSGGNGNDTYVLKTGDGQSTINDQLGANVLRFENVALSDIRLTRVDSTTGEKLVLTYGANGETVTLAPGSTMAEVEIKAGNGAGTR